MPVSYQSWEVASGPTVAYKMSGRTKGCVVVESPKGSNFSSFRLQDTTMSRGFGETPKSSNFRVLSAQDNVVWGLSALSLRGQSQSEADFPAEEIQNVSFCAFCCASAESYRCMCRKSNDSSSPAFAQPTACWKPLNLNTTACNASFVPSSETGHEAATLLMQGSATGNFAQADFEDLPQAASPLHAAAPASLCRGDEGHEHGSVGSFSKTFRSPSTSLHSTREFVSKDDDFEPDAMSESSLCSGNDMPLASSPSSCEASHDDSEAQSVYKEPSGLSFSVGASSPPRKGLSKFYAGKSRSFSCLTDVCSVKDLAKPEIPHTKKRRANSSTSGLPPLQKGACAISKKPLHSGKSTLALAVAMNQKEEHEVQASLRPARQQKSLVPSRSYSLSDLQRATGSIFFIG